MGQAIDCGLMPFRKLAISEIDGKSFKSAHIKVIDKLHDPHGVDQSPFFCFARNLRLG
jgi:hypothetical protein